MQMKRVNAQFHQIFNLMSYWNIAFTISSKEKLVRLILKDFDEEVKDVAFKCFMINDK